MSMPNNKLLYALSFTNRERIMISEELIIQLIKKKNYNQAFSVAQLILLDDPDNKKSFRL
jgi:hypothetical protein